MSLGTNNGVLTSTGSVKLTGFPAAKIKNFSLAQIFGNTGVKTTTNKKNIVQYVHSNDGLKDYLENMILDQEVYIHTVSLIYRFLYIEIHHFLGSLKSSLIAMVCL